MSDQRAWQLDMFSKSLKKRQKLALLLRQLGPLEHESCLLITNGDNNGAMNHFFRAHGGRWIWIENEADHIDEMQELLGEPVLAGSPERIPVPDDAFDVAISIDVHEHLADCTSFGRELSRVVKPGGRVIVTTPNGDAWKPVTMLKNAIGMTKERYGHHVIGYNMRQHQEMLAAAGFEPAGAGSYSKFFTEMIELAINAAYVLVLSKKSAKKGAPTKEGTIAPSSKNQLAAVEKQYRIYSAIYPLIWTVSRLDLLLPFFTGYAVSVVGRRRP